MGRARQDAISKSHQGRWVWSAHRDWRSPSSTAMLSAIRTRGDRGGVLRLLAIWRLRAATFGSPRGLKIITGFGGAWRPGRGHLRAHHRAPRAAAAQAPTRHARAWAERPRKRSGLASILRGKDAVCGGRPTIRGQPEPADLQRAAGLHAAGPEEHRPRGELTYVANISSASATTRRTSPRWWSTLVGKARSSATCL